MISTTENDFYLPPGLELIPDEDLEKEPSFKNSISYPTKTFYSDHATICKKLGYDVNTINIKLITDFMNKNAKVLKPGWKKPKK